MKTEIAISQPHKKTKYFVGRTTALLLSKSAKFFQDKNIYICGSTPMIEDIVQILCNEKKVERENIFFEKFW